MKVSPAPKSLLFRYSLSTCRVLLPPTVFIHFIAGWQLWRSKTSQECDCCHVLEACSNSDLGWAVGWSWGWMTREGKDFLERKIAWPALWKNVSMLYWRALVLFPARSLQHPRAGCWEEVSAAKCCAGKRRKPAGGMLLGVGLAGALVSRQVDEEGLSQPANRRWNKKKKGNVWGIPLTYSNSISL